MNYAKGDEITITFVVERSTSSVVYDTDGNMWWRDRLDRVRTESTGEDNEQE